MWTRVVGVAVLGALVACGGGGDDDDDDDLAVDAAPFDASEGCLPFGPAPQGANAGFLNPDQTLFAYAKNAGAWELQGAANFSCLCSGGGDGTTAAAVGLTGETRDYQTDDIVDNVDVAAFASGGPPTTPIDATTSDQDGAYTLAFPAGTGPVDLYLSDPEGNRFLDSVLYHHVLDPTGSPQILDLRSFSYLTANALPAFIGVMRTEGLGLMNGTVVDCDGNRVAGAIGTVSDVSRTSSHLSGATTYYFSAGSTSLPVRHSQRSYTNFDGLFAVIQMPPTQIAYIQAWGYLEGQSPGVDPIALLSEIKVSVAADTWSQATLEPLRR